MFNNYVQNKEKYFYPLKEDVILLLNDKSTEIDSKLLENYSKLLLISEDKDFSELMNTLIIKCQTQLIEKRKSDILKKVILFILKKLNKLVNCQMCLGFWAGVALAILCVYNPIVIFGETLQIVTSLNILAIFIFGLIAAGTTWALDQIVEYFSNNQNR